MFKRVAAPGGFASVPVTLKQFFMHFVVSAMASGTLYSCTKNSTPNQFGDGGAAQGSDSTNANSGSLTQPSAAPNSPSERPELSFEEQLAQKRQQRQNNCSAVSASARFQVAAPAQNNFGLDYNIGQLMQTIYGECSNCHAPRIGLGGFRFVGTYDEQTVTVNGADVVVPGIAQVAERIQAAVGSGSMPPDAATRQEYFQSLAGQLEKWVAAGKPRPESAAVFASTAENTSGAASADPQKSLPTRFPSLWGFSDTTSFSSLGDCIPLASSLSDQKDADQKLAVLAAKDDFFAAAEVLPKKLSETDLFTFDVNELALAKTFAYDVEYPLWNDFAKKLRHVRLPLNVSERTLQQVKLLADADLKNQEYDLPENTRFYKTFFAQRKTASGAVEYKPMETRVIVVRYGREALYGTYVWNDEFSEANLLETPYRDGTPWKDLVLKDVFDASATLPDGSKPERQYVVPAKHRCAQCHEGTARKSFVLGFTPYQLNIQALGHDGQPKAVVPEKLEQMNRLTSFGVFSTEAAAFRPALRDLPRLDRVPSQRPETFDFVLDAQGYFIGNCAHCHNPNGYANKEGGVKFDLRAGYATDFPTYFKPTKFSNDNLKVVDGSGNLEVSYLYRKVAGDENDLRGQDRMPLHTAGGPHCDAVTAVSRWILSYNTQLSRNDILAFKPGKPCANEFDFTRPQTAWYDEDPTVNEKDYAPRRTDWKDPVNGMQPRFKEIVFNETLKSLGSTEFPTGWWLNVDEKCRFPTTENTEQELQKWDSKGLTWIRAGVESTRSPKALSQLYTTTPGAHFFGQTCVKCHGRLGRGDGVIAKDFKSIQPANFVNGMFGQGGANKDKFNDELSNGQPVNLTAQYFVWMAMEGTRLKDIPPAAVDIVGKYQGRMLGQIRDNCLRLLTGESAYARDRLLYQEVCEFENLPIDSPELSLDAEGVPVNPAKLEAWLDKGAINAGYLIFEYVEDYLAKGRFKPTQGECDLVPEFKTGQ